MLVSLGSSAQSTSTITVREAWSNGNTTTYQIIDNNSYSPYPMRNISRLTTNHKFIYQTPKKTSGIEYETDLREALDEHIKLYSNAKQRDLEFWLENNHKIQKFANKYGYPREERLRKIYPLYSLNWIFD